MGRRGVTVIVLNHSDEELDLDTESVHLWHGQWAPAESMPPEVIQPRESVLWYCKATGLGRGIEGSVTYRMAGPVPHDKVRFQWKNRYFGPNFYGGQTTRDGYTVHAKGGQGGDSVVVFVFGKVV